MKASEMQFPVLRLNKRHIRRFDSPSQLERMTQKYFDSGEFMEDAYFLDCAAEQFHIERISKLRRSWHFSYWFAPSPGIVVDIDVVRSKKLSLTEMKTLIVDLVTSNKWYRQGGEDQQSFRLAFERATDPSELIAFISFYGQWQG